MNRQVSGVRTAIVRRMALEVQLAGGSPALFVLGAQDNGLTLTASRTDVRRIENQELFTWPHPLLDFLTGGWPDATHVTVRAPFSGRRETVIGQMMASLSRARNGVHRNIALHEAAVEMPVLPVKLSSGRELLLGLEPDHHGAALTLTLEEAGRIFSSRNLKSADTIAGDLKGLAPLCATEDERLLLTPHVLLQALIAQYPALTHVVVRLSTPRASGPKEAIIGRMLRPTTGFLKSTAPALANV